MHTVFLSAAEPSGDLLAAELLQALQRRAPVVARGCAGPAMRAAGVEAIVEMESITAMGVAEVLAKLGPLKRARAALSAGLREGADLFIGVDAPDLHLPLARIARQQGTPAVGYVSPQVWAWRPGRVEGIAASLDQLLCLFAFEPPLYAEAAARHGCDVRFVGHPLLDRLPARGPVDPDLYGLLPASREHELRRHLPVFFAAAEALQAERPGARFGLVVPEALHGALGPLPEGVRLAANAADLAGARAALTKSGTVTLELGRMGVPLVVAHQVHPLTYALGRLLVRGVNHIALPNILAGREVVPEHLQSLDPAALCRALLALPDHQALDLSALGEPGAADRAAHAITDLWAARPAPGGG